MSIKVASYVTNFNGLVELKQITYYKMTRDWESLLLANAKPYVQGTREHATVQWACFSSEKETVHCHFTASDHIYWLAMPYRFQKP